ncbi:aminotransferase class I/II-fold pyridoxal phosphate-dependent enzyme, partial [Streptomyces polyrhachis]
DAAAAEPPGGGATLRAAAAGYFDRRGLPTDPDRLTAATGARPLLLALLAALPGDVLLPRPAAPWYAAPAHFLGRPVHPVPVPAESGGAPDPVALLETVARVRAEGGRPRVLLLSVADEATGTVPPPEVLYEVCEAAAGAGLLVIGDESLRDTAHDPHATLPVSPAEITHDRAVALSDLGAWLLPPGLPAAVARFPAGADGAALHAHTTATLASLGATLAAPVAAAAAYALTEPPPVTARTRAGVRLARHLAAAVGAVLHAHGAEFRPPRAGAWLYADFEERRAALAAHDVRDSAELESWLAGRLGPYRVTGGFCLGDRPEALRVRFALLPLAGTAPQERAAALTSPDPLRLPQVVRELSAFDAVIAELTGAAR